MYYQSQILKITQIYLKEGNWNTLIYVPWKETKLKSEAVQCVIFPKWLLFLHENKFCLSGNFELGLLNPISVSQISKYPVNFNLSHITNNHDSKGENLRIQNCWCWGCSEHTSCPWLMAPLTHGPLTFGQHLPVQFHLKRVPLKRNHIMHSKTVVGTCQKMGMTEWRNSEAFTVDLY